MPTVETHESLFRRLNRRELLHRCISGMGTAVLASLLAEDGAAVPARHDGPLAPKRAHFPPQARNIIYLKMAGAPSQLDLFDHKPQLKKLDGQTCPEKFVENQQFAFIVGRPKLLGSPFSFARYGDSGAEISELLPHTARIADQLCVIKSLQTDQFNHTPALLFLQTGSTQPGLPSMGSWLSYGLGSSAQELPAFVVLTSGRSSAGQNSVLWSSGCLPSVYQGVQLRSQGDPVPHLSNPAGVASEQRGWSLETINALNRVQLERMGNPEIATRMEQYELAFRMQASVPELMRFEDEPASIHRLYGTEPGKRSFANNCLLARRLVERGVRFVQLYHGNWDTHGSDRVESIQYGLPDLCRDVDQASAALVTDLKRRGLLDQTLVIWGGEFGRTPMYENRPGFTEQQHTFLGRDHHRHAFTIWMAGGGVKAGMTHGQTDDLGYWVTENPVQVHDLQATILYLMGLDHTRLTFRFQGRDIRLTDVRGNVVNEIISSAQFREQRES